MELGVLQDGTSISHVWACVAKVGAAHLKLKYHSASLDI